MKIMFVSKKKESELKELKEQLKLSKEILEIRRDSCRNMIEADELNAEDCRKLGKELSRCDLLRWHMDITRFRDLVDIGELYSSMISILEALV